MPATPNLKNADGCLGAISIGIAALVVSVMIVLAGGMLPLVGFVLPIVLLATMLISLAVGFPIFLLLRRTGRLHWLIVGLGGLVTGAIVPALMVLPEAGAEHGSVGTVVTIAEHRYLIDTWVPGAAVTAGFGIAGFMGALIAWRILLAGLPDATRSLRVHAVALIVGSFCASLCVHMLLTDHSCHNVLRNGSTGAAPVASFNLHVPPSAWPGLRDEFRRFASDRDWSFALGQGEFSRPAWLDMDVCEPSGTQIAAMPTGDNGADVSISVYQPQGGNSWQRSFLALQRRIESEWPGSVSYPFQPPPPWPLLVRARSSHSGPS